ncbi:hypothetical protein NDU88_003129 [Pleurodeles waltl]|uniref:Uncharacterized protein n=1 Tax=Pleurodeles waltl TaxID=8319 RepID=A0AAV7TMR1_PLEWA|nr:hypothetical protein NDU88_003129 [Pleurodeles waltl]
MAAATSTTQRQWRARDRRPEWKPPVIPEAQVIRGQAQAPIGGKKKDIALKCEEIERDITKPENQLTPEGTDDLRHPLRLHQGGLHALEEEKAQIYNMATQHQLYDV